MELNVTRKRGDTDPDVFIVSKNRVPTNLAGCSFKLSVNTLKEPVDTSTEVYQLIGIITDPASGKVSFRPTAEQANQVGYFYYDIQMVDSYGDTQTVVEGTYKYEQDITK